MRICVFAIFAAGLAAQTELAQKAELAKSYLAGSRFEDAAKLYGELVKALPNNPGLLLNQGMALHMAGKDLQAIPVLQQALKLNPKIPPAQLFLGASYIRTNQPALALAPLENFIATVPEHLEARQMMVDAASALGETSRALPHLEALARIQPDRSAIWYELGRAYESMAFETFQQMEKAFPESGPWFALLADSRSKISQNRAAYFFYRKALAKSPNLRGVHAAIAGIYRRTEHPDWAAQEDDLEAKLGKPNCAAAKTPECEFNAGRWSSVLALAKARPTADGFYWRVRAYDALARQSFGRLGELPASSDAFRFQAESLRDQGKHPESIAAWREALKLEPNHPGLQRELAASLLLAKEYAEAQEITSALLAAEPNAPDLQNLQGDLYLAQQMAAEAVPFLEKAAAANPQALETRASLARALLQSGQPAAALPHVTAALPTDTDGSLHIQLARAYQAAGQTDAAREAMAKYQAIQAKLKEQERVAEDQVQITPPPAK